MAAVSRRPPDAGYTLIEVSVAAAVLSAVLVIFTAGLLQVHSSVRANETVSASQRQLNQAFQRLEKEIRYASGISTPGTAGTDTHLVEYLVGSRCHQLRLRRDATRNVWQLQHRSWQIGSGAPVTAGFQLLASDVRATTPFTRLAPDATVSVQRLRVRLTADSPSATQLEVTLAALNSAGGASSVDVCRTEGR